MAIVIPEQVLAIFRDEVQGYFDEISVAVEAIERAEDAEQRSGPAQDVARKLHNIKGAASSLGLHRCSEVAHATEDMLLREARGDSDSVRRALALLVRAVSWMQDALDKPDLPADKLLQALRAPSSTRPAESAPKTTAPSTGPATAADPGQAAAADATELEPQTASAPSTTPSVRVELGALDQLLQPLSVLITQGADSRFHARALADLQQGLRSIQKRIAGGGLDVELRTDLQQLVGAMGRHVRGMEQSLRSTQHASTRIEEQIRAMRLVPLASLQKSLSLIARDAANQTGKAVGFVLRDGQTQIDRSTLELLRPALVHLIRNAIDHGIESADERRRAHKPARGQVELSASIRAGWIELRLRDDGAGVDVEQVRSHSKASAELDPTLSPDDLLGTLMQHGFSTSETVSSLSGRGVGLDVVRQCVRSLGGRLALESQRGRGACFVMRVPVRVLTTRVLVVRASGQLWGVPLNGVEGVARVAPRDHYLLTGRLHVDLLGRAARIHDLSSRASAQDSAASAAKQPALLLLSDAGPVALLVDGVEDEADIVVSPLLPPVEHLPGYLGVTLIESGSVMPVLDPGQITRLGAVAPSTEHGAPRRHVVLVVDDSITTRTLERHILESHGYVVRLATDGVEALRSLRSQAVDLVVSDVEMPRLDGFGLAESIRHDPDLKHLPLVLVTSRSDERDQRRGLVAGADAYIIKRDFDQTVLLDTVAELLRTKLPERRHG